MLNPSVGEIVSMGSPVRRRRIVVLPALSRPRIRMRISFSFSLTFYIICRLKIFTVSSFYCDRFGQLHCKSAYLFQDGKESHC